MPIEGENELGPAGWYTIVDVDGVLNVRASVPVTSVELKNLIEALLRRAHPLVKVQQENPNEHRAVPGLQPSAPVADWIRNQNHTISGCGARAKDEEATPSAPAAGRHSGDRRGCGEGRDADRYECAYEAEAGQESKGDFAAEAASKWP